MYTNVLYATDLREEHFHLNERALAIAKKLGAKLYLLHVIELPVSIQLAQGLGFTELASPAKDDALTVMKLLGEALGVPANQQFVEVGSVREAVLKKAASLDCSLIIVGSHTPDDFPALLGSSANSILHHATCDVITLRG